MNKVEFRAEEIPLPPWTSAAETFVKKVLEALGRKNWELSVLFCNNRYMKSLNARYRNRNEPTDVLSFPLGEKSRSGRYLAGDIAVSLDAVEENAGFFEVSGDEELRRLLIHGILHLSGEDHATNKTEEPMLVFQEEILSKMKNEKIIDLFNEVVPKCQILEQLPLKTIVLQAVGRKTIRACDKIIDFGTGSNNRLLNKSKFPDAEN
jgi:probable rRNA maturation factor